MLSFDKALGSVGKLDPRLRERAIGVTKHGSVIIRAA